MAVELVDPATLGLAFKVDESGDTFLENARRKAEAGMQLTGLATLAEDSGLEVPALGGAPGVRSARFAGEEATMEDRMRALIRALAERPGAARAAYFRCAAVLLLPNSDHFEGEGVLEGSIGLASRAEPAFGFGYDPIFVLPDGRFLSELSVEEKNLLSHRARAVAALEVRGAFDAVTQC